jgi:GNAT superfamily N-acetyltransferase
LWTEIVARGFAEQVPVTPDLLEVLKMFAYASGSECYLARVDGAPAGGAAVSFRKGIASLSGASTLPEFRNRGVQTVLLQARLARAKAAGCGLAMSIAHPGSVSHRNIERHGFRVMYTRVKFQKDRRA